MPKPAQTHRLVLRPMTLNDYSFLRQLHQSPDVMKYIGAGEARTEEQTRIGMDRYLQVEKENPKLGSWMVELKSTQETIGNLVIRKPATSEETEGLEIGFSFLPEYWSKGYGTECARGMIEYAYREFGKIRIVALIEAENAASRAALAKVGFKHYGFSEYADPVTGVNKPTEVLEFL